MKGRELIAHLSRKLAPATRKSPLRHGELVKKLGLSGQAIRNWQKQKRITPLRAANLVEKAVASARRSAEQEAIKPIVEFFPIRSADSKRKKYQELFSPLEAATHPYLSGLKEALRAERGIYIFYDSRGHALYAGKALRRTLWTELKSAFNRYRDVQEIKRVRHPLRRSAFRTGDEMQRQIVKQNMALHSLARYVSAYSVPIGFINTLEALLIRGFANDLLNARMERFARPRPKKKKKRSHRRRRLVRRRRSVV